MFVIYIYIKKKICIFLYTSSLGFKITSNGEGKKIHMQV